ncbi:MAG: hypothetical protein H6Q15_2098 [Bacteroidetes bacterium]|nr:hypothetical protein [Bacteroidota bacterium]
MAKKSNSNNTVVTQIVNEFKDLNRAEINKWRNALAMANDITTPRNYILQDLYDNLYMDGHLISQIGLRKAATTGYGFSIIDKKSSQINQEKTELFNSAWFYSLVDNVLDSIFKGYTLLELVDPTKMEFSLIPRRNTIGRKQIVLFEASGDKGIDISKGFENTIIHCGDKNDLGLLSNLCGLLIWKRNAQQSWAEFAEKFGMPLLTATTTSSSPTDIAKVRTMLNALGEAARAVLPEGTSIDIKPFAGSDSYQVYDKQIERINGELAKPITGGTMITDNGSSKSQSEVHEKNLDDKIAESDRRMIQFIVNEQLLPIMQYWGWDINPENDKFLFDTSFEVSLTDHWNIVNQILVKYDVPSEWISKTFNVPIAGEKKPQKEEQNKPVALTKGFR